MPLGLVLTLCGLGAAFLITGLILTAVFVSKKKNCTAMTTGNIVDYKTGRDSDGDFSFYPIYEYYANGQTYRGQGASISNQIPGKDTLLVIMYNPENPKQSYIEGYDDKVYKILGIIFSLIGCIPIIICICIALFA